MQDIKDDTSHKLFVMDRIMSNVIAKILESYLHFTFL